MLSDSVSSTATLSSQGTVHGLASTPSTNFGASLMSGSLNAKKISPKSATHAGRVTSTKFTLNGNSSGSGSGCNSSGIVTVHIPAVSTTARLNPDAFDSMDVGDATIGPRNSMPPPPPRLPKSGIGGGVSASAMLPSPVSILTTSSPLSSHLNVLSHTASQRDPIIVFPTSKDQVDVTTSSTTVTQIENVESMMIDEESDEPKILSPRRSRPRSFSHGSLLSSTSSVSNIAFENESNSNEFDRKYDTRSWDVNNFVNEVQQRQAKSEDEECSNEVDSLLYDGSPSECDKYQQQLLRRQRSISVGSGEGSSCNVKQSSTTATASNQQMKKSTSFTSCIKWIATSGSCETIPEHHLEDDPPQQTAQTRDDSTTSACSLSNHPSDLTVISDNLIACSSNFGQIQSPYFSVSAIASTSMATATPPSIVSSKDHPDPAVTVGSSASTAQLF
jgi:hypothetical protein